MVEEQQMSVVDALRREVPVRERRSPQRLKEYVSRFYRMYCYVTQKTESVLEGGNAVNLREHTLGKSGGPEKGS